MKLRDILLVTAALPLLGACVYGGGYAEPGYGGGPAYYGDAYPTHTYIEYNNSYSHRGGYRENYWAHDRAREENFHHAPSHVEDHHEAAHEDHEEHGGHPWTHR